MRTDELRRELQQLADEIEPFEPDALAVHRTVRRRRTIWSVAAALVIVVATGTILSVTRSGSGNAAITASKKEYAPSALHRLDAIVVPDSPNVQRVLEQSPLVERYTPVSRGALVGNANALQGSVLQQVSCALQSQAGFLVESSEPGRAIGRDLQREFGKKAKVFDVSEGNGSDFEIFMQPNAAAAQIDGVRTALTTNPDVHVARFLNHQDAYNEFARIFKDQPGLVQSANPDTLPESFRVIVAEHASPAAVAREFEHLPGVDNVIVRSAQNVFLFASGLPLPTTALHDNAEVFLNVAATDADVRAIRDALARDPSVASARFLDHQAALAEFRRIFADQPALLANTTAAQLPESFRVTLRDPYHATVWANSYRGRPHVDDVAAADQKPDTCTKG